MKKLNLLVIISLMAYEGFAQEVVIANAKLNILHVGVDNLIEIAVPNVSLENISVSVDNTIASIHKVSKGKYTVRVKSIGSGELDIQVEAGGKFLFKKFLIKYVPDPVAAIEGVEGNYMTANSLKTATGLKVVLPNFPLDVNCTIERYVVVITPKYSEPVEYFVRGNVFPDRLAAEFKNMEAGTTVRFQNIMARVEKDAAAREINDLCFTVR